MIASTPENEIVVDRSIAIAPAKTSIPRSASKLAAIFLSDEDACSTGITGTGSISAPLLGLAIDVRQLGQVTIAGALELTVNR